MTRWHGMDDGEHGVEETEMKRHVALLRGINVGRAKRVVMADWRVLLESLGFSNVRTLLNSGNAVFDAPPQAAAELADRIHGSLAQTLGVSARVVVKTANEFAAIVKGSSLIDGENGATQQIALARFGR